MLILDPYLIALGAPQVVREPYDPHVPDRLLVEPVRGRFSDWSQIGSPALVLIERNRWEIWPIRRITKPDLALSPGQTAQSKHKATKTDKKR